MRLRERSLGNLLHRIRNISHNSIRIIQILHRNRITLRIIVPLPIRRIHMRHLRDNRRSLHRTILVCRDRGSEVLHAGVETHQVGVQEFVAGGVDAGVAEDGGGERGGGEEEEGVEDLHFEFFYGFSL